MTPRLTPSVRRSLTGIRMFFPRVGDLELDRIHGTLVLRARYSPPRVSFRNVNTISSISSMFRRSSPLEQHHRDVRRRTPRFSYGNLNFMHPSVPCCTNRRGPKDPCPSTNWGEARENKRFYSHGRLGPSTRFPRRGVTPLERVPTPRDSPDVFAPEG